MRPRPSYFVAAGLVAASVLAWWLWPREGGSLRRAGEPPPPPAMQRTPRAGHSESKTVAPRAASPAQPEAEGDVEGAPTGDLSLYAERPMSSVPHHVARAWGMTGDSQPLGLVGAYLVVSPEISEAELTNLCRDILHYHRDAKVLAVRILDSPDGAATSERDAYGGGLAEQHLVARVSRDRSAGIETCLVRGEVVKP